MELPSEEDMTAVFVGLLFFVAAIAILVGLLTANAHQQASTYWHPDPTDLVADHRPASELGHMAGDRWVCDRHKTVDCRFCATRVSVWDIASAHESDEDLASQRR